MQINDVYLRNDTNKPIAFKSDDGSMYTLPPGEDTYITVLEASSLNVTSDQPLAQDTDQERAASEQPLPEQFNPPLAITDSEHAIFQDGIVHGIARATEMLAKAHTHKFSYHLNQGHTLVAGCECGLCFGGLVAGPNPRELILHRVYLEGMQEE